MHGWPGASKEAVCGGRERHMEEQRCGARQDGSATGQEDFPWLWSLVLPGCERVDYGGAGRKALASTLVAMVAAS